MCAKVSQIGFQVKSVLCGNPCIEYIENVLSGNPPMKYFSTMYHKTYGTIYKRCKCLLAGIAPPLFLATSPLKVTDHGVCR